MDTFSWYACENGSNQKKNKSVPLCNLSNLQLRFLCPSDLEDVQALCRDWFPIAYPYAWYEDITSNPRFYSLAAIYNGVIVGLIVAEIKAYCNLNKEDRSILSSSYGKSATVAYMLSLGVSEEHRRNGIASLLLDNLVSHLTLPENRDCKALFLHVLTSNKPAILFYENRNFKLHSFLPYYYSIKGTRKDGFTYVLYLNGGHQPWAVYDYVKHYGHFLFRGDLCRKVSFTTFYKVVKKVWLTVQTAIVKLKQKYLDVGACTKVVNVIISFPYSTPVQCENPPYRAWTKLRTVDYFSQKSTKPITHWNCRYNYP